MLPRMTPGCAGFDASNKRNATRSNAKALAGDLASASLLSAASSQYAEDGANQSCARNSPKTVPHLARSNKKLSDNLFHVQPNTAILHLIQYYSKNIPVSALNHRTLTTLNQAKGQLRPLCLQVCQEVDSHGALCEFFHPPSNQSQLMGCKQCGKHGWSKTHLPSQPCTRMRQRKPTPSDVRSVGGCKV